MELDTGGWPAGRRSVAVIEVALALPALHIFAASPVALIAAGPVEVAATVDAALQPVN